MCFSPGASRCLGISLSVTHGYGSLMSGLTSSLVLVLRSPDLAPPPRASHLVLAFSAQLSGVNWLFCSPISEFHSLIPLEFFLTFS